MAIYKKMFKYVIRYVFSFISDILVFFVAYRARIGSSLLGYHIVKQYPEYLKTHNAKRGIESMALQFVSGTSLDIGAGKSCLMGCRPIENNFDENAYNINEKDSSVNFIFSSHCLEHLENPKKAIAECHRILKSGAKFLTYLPHPACEMWLQNVNQYHVSLHQPHEWKQLFSAAGFKIIDISYTPDGMMSFYILAEKQKD